MTENTLKRFTSNFTTYFNTPKVDSLRIHIPFNRVKIVSNSLDKSLTTINADGEVIEEHIQTRKHKIKNGIGVSFAKVKFCKGSINKTYLTIGFSAKLLQHRYLEGINQKNIKDIYKYIIAQDEVQFSFDTFLDASVVDVDICMDYMIETSTKEVCQIAHKLTQDKYKPIANLFNQKNNIGIEWNKRNYIGKAYKTKQYLKYYSKGMELISKSYDFYKTYLKPQFVLEGNDIEKWLRIETTIKNKKHFESYGKDISTLRELLLFDDQESLNYFQRPINNYMNGINTLVMPKNRDELSARDVATIHHIEMAMEYKRCTITEAINDIVTRVDDEKGLTKQEKYKLNKYYSKIADYIEKQIQSNKVKMYIDDIKKLRNYTLFPNT
jgi:hypothetical protein